jgi:hypothetical protein
VRGILDEHPLVEAHHKATDASSWGATIAHLVDDE